MYFFNNFFKHFFMTSMGEFPAWIASHFGESASKELRDYNYIIVIVGASAEDAVLLGREKPRSPRRGQASRSTPTLAWCKTSVSLSRGQSVRDEPRARSTATATSTTTRTIRVVRTDRLDRPHRCENGTTPRRLKLPSRDSR